MNNHRSILELPNKEAKAFFLKSASYNNLDLPPYFVFDELLKTIDEIINNKKLLSLQSESPSAKRLKPVVRLWVEFTLQAT